MRKSSFSSAGLVFCVATLLAAVGCGSGSSEPTPISSVVQSGGGGGYCDCSNTGKVDDPPIIAVLKCNAPNPDYRPGICFFPCPYFGGGEYNFVWPKGQMPTNSYVTGKTEAGTCNTYVFEWAE